MRARSESNATPRLWRALAIALLIAGCARGSAAGISDGGPTFAAAGTAALQTLEDHFYDHGNWQVCEPADAGCGTSDLDWGADALTFTLWLQWSLTRDATIPPMLQALNANGLVWGTCTQASCPYWSDVPQWDSIAAAREYQATGDRAALARAEGAFNYVDSATRFALGACPEIDYQQPGGGANQLKTLESDSNYVKAALLLDQLTGDSDYLYKAIAKYEAVRTWFKDPAVALYTVYLFDDGSTCTQLPARFFASVNGDMIWSGLALAAATGNPTYASDAIATGQAVAAHLHDASGLYVDLQAENDVVEPLVEAMYLLATDQGEAFAQEWIELNAAALASDRTSAGAYGRFWNGPPPAATISEWQINGGFALAFAAAALAPDGLSAADLWRDAGYVADDISTLPATLSFTGSAVALIGTIGENCCG